MERWRATSGRSPRPAAGTSVGLLPKIIAAFVAVLALASLVTLLLETRLTRQQLEVQAVTLFRASGDVLDARIASDADRINRLMSIVAQSFGSPSGLPADDVDLEARRTLSLVRTSDDDLVITGVFDGRTGEAVATGLPTRQWFASPDPDDVARLILRPGSSQRVVPLDDGGYGVAYVLPLRRSGDHPRLVATGYALDEARARRFREQTGVDAVEIVVDGTVVATTEEGTDGRPSGVPTLTRTTQQLEDGRLVRYVALGTDRAWDNPAAIGLITDDPLAALDAGLAQTRLLMAALLLLIGGALAYASARVMTRPIVALTRTATAIADGELDRAFVVERGDEIGRLGDALERMRRALRAQLLVIRRQSDALQAAARRVVAAQDSERQRIAQDLHDGIQQQLVVLRMQVGVAKARLAADPDQLVDVTDGLADGIDHLLDQLRSRGQALFPSILGDRGLGAALFSLAGRIAIPLEVTLDPDPLPRVATELEINAYFLVSEAVMNALKHAQADRIQVTVRCEDADLRVQIEDDGVGFDPGAAGHRGGLVHMRDRVNALRGSIQLVSRPGEGTRVTAVFPRRMPGTEASVRGSLEEEQHGGDPSVEVEVLRETELPEDGVGVLLDGSIRDGQFPSDRGVPLA